MTTPDDTLYGPLLRAYIAPLDDAGFSDRVISHIAARHHAVQQLEQALKQAKSTARLRLLLASLAAIMGGGLTALYWAQLSRLIAFFSTILGMDDSELYSTDVENGFFLKELGDGLSFVTYPAGFAACFVFILLIWVIIDNRGISIF